MKKYFSNLYLKKILVVALIGGLSACQEQEKSTANSDTNTVKTTVSTNHSNIVASALTAKQISKKYIITDSHIDVPYRLEELYEDVSSATEKGDFDYPRAKAGGLDAPFMSIYIPASLEEQGSGSKALADKLIDMVEAIATKSPDKFALSHSTKQMQSNFDKGIISLPMGMENGSAIEGDMKNLQHFYQRGIRYITLAHSKANHISDSSYDENRPAKGLTDFGKKLVVEMNNTGVMIDVSHISDEAFYQVMEISKVPVIASHSSARHFTPGWERNMSDEMIKRLAKNGGVIQINLGSSFISQESYDSYKTFDDAQTDFIQEQGVEKDSEEVKAFAKKYREEIPFRYATLDEVLDHFTHVIDLVGIDYVGIGSDYDGVGDSLPIGLKDVSAYPNLIQGLIDRGIDEEGIGKILSGNLIRVWKQSEEYAAKQKGAQE